MPSQHNTVLQTPRAHTHSSSRLGVKQLALTRWWEEEPEASEQKLLFSKTNEKLHTHGKKTHNQTTKTLFPQKRGIVFIPFYTQKNEGEGRTSKIWQAAEATGNT